MGVTIQPKYVNSADVMADMSLTTPSKDRPAAAAAEGVAAREPYWDLIELLFFAYRDFVSDPASFWTSSASDARTIGCCILSIATLV